MKKVSHSALLSVGVLSSLAAAPAAAAPPRALTEAVTRVVRFADLDITTAAGAESLYGRIVSAARYVCREAQLSDAKACRAHAVDRGVADVGNALLTSIHRSISSEAEEIARR